MDEEIKEVGEMATIEGEEEITIEEDYTTLEAETIIIDDDSNIQTDAEYEQAVAQKELADKAREALSAVLLSVLEKGEINDDDIAEIAAQQEIYTENVTALKILGITTEGGKSTTNVITSNIDYDELIKVLSEKADWLYIDEDGQVMLNGEVVPKIKVVELEAEKIKADVGEFKNLTTENFTATNAEITNLKSDYGEFKDLTANNFTATNGEITNLKSNKADIEYLQSNYATIQNLNTNIASINTALIDKANVSDLNATNANITNLQATKANVSDLNAAKANITTLTSNLADITTLVNGNLTSDNIQSINITGDKFTVANGFIKNAMIDSVSANKINTGTINTNNVKIQSADGSMVINGTTQQFKDKNNKVRIQIGKDAQGNFTFALFSQDGVGVLIDETGIKSGAVPNGLIVNDMVSNNANISGSKLDINSVVSSINNGTTTIKGTKIQLDEQGQSLQVAFSQLKSKVETIENVTIDGDLSSVIEQVTTNTTSINTMQGQISSLISNTTITKANGEVVQLKDEYNSTKSTVNSHSTKIGSLETNLATANNNISSVSSKQTALEQNLNGFKQTVSQTYTTKSEFNGLQIGGTNLVANSAPQSTSHWSPSTGWAISLVDCTTAPYGKAIRVTNNSATNGGCHKAPIDYTKCVNGEYYTISAWIRASKSCKIDFHNEMMVNTNRINITTSWKYYTFTSKINTGVQYHSDVFYVSTDTISTGMWLEVHSLKLEKGTKPSSWSPAPEDIDSSIASVDGKFTNYSTTSQMNSAINQKANEITSSVSQTYATKTALNTVDGKFANYSTTSAMNSAINQKANEITSSVSQTYATKTALKATDDKFANYSTTSQMNTAINQKSDAILSTVSATYTTKADFNNLEIGGRNFLVGTKNAFTRAINTANIPNNFTTNDPYATYNSQTLSSLGLKVGDKITVSFDWNLSNVTTAGNFRVETVQDSNYKTLISGPHNFGSNTSGRYVGTKTLTSDDVNINKIRIRVDASNFTMTIKNMKLEKGNKDTSWSPAPEDIDASITAVDSKFTNYSTTSQMNSAINQKANEITSSVSNTYATKAALNTVDGKFANYSTTSAMNTAINQKAESITQSVSNTYATKTALNSTNNNITSLTNRMSSAESKLTKNSLTTTIGNYYTTSTDVNGLITNKGYATTSQVSQTATDLTAKFTSSGGYNLLRNSVFTRDTSYWSTGSHLAIDTSRIFNGHNSLKITSTGATSDVWRGITQRFVTNAPSGKTYTASLWYYVADKSTFNSDFTLEIKGKKTGASSEEGLVSKRISASNLVQGVWTKISVTVTTSESWEYIFIYPWVQRNGTIWITELQVEEGSLATLWTPHPYEAYDGITQISKDGVKVFHNSIDSNSYTHMSPSGFYLKNKGTDILKVDSNGLYLKGNGEFTGTISASIINGSTINGSNINSDSFVGDMLAIDGVISAKSLQVQDIDNAKYPGAVTADFKLYVSTSGNDDSEIENGATFRTFDGLLDKLPKNLNGHEVHIEMSTNITENVDFKGFFGGKIRLYMKGHTLYGYVVSRMGSARINICSGYIGNATDESNGWGKIHPSKGYAVSTYTTTVACTDPGAIGLYNIDVYGADNYLSGSSTKLGVAAQDFGAVYLKGVSYYGCDIGARANVGGRIHDALSYNVCTKYGFYATSGGYITLAGSEHSGGKSKNYHEADAGKVIVASGATFASGAASVPGGSAPVVSTTKTITIKSTYGDTYRSSVYNNWKKDGTCRQGDYGYGDCNGVWFFGDAFSDVEGKTITKVEIKITRQSGGTHSAVGLVVKSHGHSSRPSGAPTYRTTAGTLSLATGASGTLTITNSTILSEISSGAVKGFGIQTTYDSSHYAVCSGSVTVKITYTE